MSIALWFVIVIVVFTLFLVILAHEIRAVGRRSMPPKNGAGTTSGMPEG